MKKLFFVILTLVMVAIFFKKEKSKVDQSTKTISAIEQNQNKKIFKIPKNNKAAQVSDSSPSDKKDTVVLENKFALRNVSRVQCAFV